jgi:hypothetical protein
MGLVLAVQSIDLPKTRHTVGLGERFAVGAFAESRSPGFHTSEVLNCVFGTCPTFREVDVYRRGKTVKRRGKIYVSYTKIVSKCYYELT